MTMPTIRTRRESYEATISELGRRQAEVYEIVKERGLNYGITAWEITKKTGRLVHAIRPRLTELQSLGLIEARGVQFHPETNRNEAVWFPVSIEEDGGFDGDQGVLL